MKKRIAVSLFVASLVPTGFFLHRHAARASEVVPSRLDPLDLAQFDAAGAHIALLEQQAQPFLETRARIAAKYKFQVQDLRPGGVYIDPTTGDIHRPAAAAK